MRESESSFDCTVIKLGGSLIDAADLKTQLWSLVKTSRRCLILPGGGAAADEIRRLDRLASLTAIDSHWSAIQAMTFNAEILVRTCGPGLVLVTGREPAQDVWNSGKVAVLNPAVFLHDEEKAIAAEQIKSLDPLPACWDVTSDSIAAWVAHRWPARQLVLAKSCEQPAGSIVDWSKTGAVDGYFPQVSNGLQIEWINLRKMQL